MLRSIELNGQIVWPFFHFNAERVPLIPVFAGDEEYIRENVRDMIPEFLLSVEGMPTEQFNIAVHNKQVIEFRDLIDAKLPDTDGLTWLAQDGMVVVNQDDTEQVVLVAASNQHQANNLIVAGAAMDTLHCCVGLYNHIHAAGEIKRDDPEARVLLDYLLQTLRKAGVMNIRDFDYEVSE